MSASLTAKSNRPGKGASRAPRLERNGARPLSACLAIFHLDDGGGSQPHELLRRLLETNAHRETLSDPDPVQGPLDIGHRARKIDAVGVEHAVPDALDNAPDRLGSVDHRVGGDAVADVDGV